MDHFIMLLISVAWYALVYFGVMWLGRYTVDESRRKKGKKNLKEM